jgi:DNA polymerase-4
MHVKVIPGVGPATVDRLRRSGVHTVADLQEISEDELVRMLGKAHGHLLHELAFARDDRRVEAERETKSVSVEGTYEQDLTDRRLMESLLTRQAGEVAGRLRKHGLSGRTVSIKVRLYDFTTLSRSTTLPSPTDDEAVVARLARRLLEDLDTSGGVRLLGVGVSGLADWVQDELFPTGAETDDDEDDGARAPAPPPQESGSAAPDPAGGYRPGMDVVHTDHGRGWVWGAGKGVVTVRFETADTPPGPVRTFPVADESLTRWHASATAIEDTDPETEGDP